MIKASEHLDTQGRGEILQLSRAVLQIYRSANSQYFVVVLRLDIHFGFLSALVQEKNIPPGLKRLKGLEGETFKVLKG